MLDGVTPQWIRWMFGRIARRYDLTNTLLSAGLDRYWRWQLARRVAQAKARAVLDVACGTGSVMLEVARHCPATTWLVGVDFTVPMLEVGRRRLARARGAARFCLCAGDALCLPFADACFDAVTIVFGVRNFADPAAGLAECYRVLRPRGGIYVVEFSWPHRWGLRQLYGLYFRYILPLVAWPLSGERSAYRYLRDSVLAFRQQPGLTALLRQAGFTATCAVPLCGGITTLYQGYKPAYPEAEENTPWPRGA
ncbi:MAG: demethylmenaquinone methyltransferase [Candidatus Tectimicrobiota bacterium]|nr:MAG: demethylmenaquinone methyltransferase [Candidatus Tectomicrobia bacterium]